MCAIVGIIGPDPVNQEIYDGLTVLQHRGQDAAGMFTADGERVFLRKDNGLVRDVFYQRHMLQLSGDMGIGHVRYPTAGCDSRAEAQPFYVNSPFGLALGHNGNLTNTRELSEALFREDLRHINTNSDSEILLNVFAHELHAALGSSRLRASPDDIFNAVSGVFKRCKGAYAVVVLIVGYGLLAFRDPCGIRPLVYGSRAGKNGKPYHMIASESVALDVLGYKLEQDVAPGQAVFFDLEGNVTKRICAESPKLTPCLFEYVYLARPDSIIDDIAVYKTRMRMGEKLGRRLKQSWPDNDIDVVIPVPDTSRTSALQMAWELGIKYREGFIKNRYIGRTFIMPGQAERRKSVRQKLNAIDLEFRGKNVLLVDDSIVRGTTSKQIIQMARDAGARKVYFASAAPPVRYPNVYGIDMPTTDELIGSGRDSASICKAIGADKVFYQRLEDLEDAVREGNSEITEFDASCFSGIYVTGDVTAEYLQHIENMRGARDGETSANELDSMALSELA
jgi:amidophosphoribosyltransferase